MTLPSLHLLAPLTALAVLAWVIRSDRHEQVNRCGAATEHRRRARRRRMRAAVGWGAAAMAAWTSIAIWAGTWMLGAPPW